MPEPAPNQPDPRPTGEMGHGDDVPTAAIEVAGFSFDRAKRCILREVSFRVERGDYFAIVGPNGAGKTTLLKCLARILLGGTGQIALEGRPLDDYSQKSLARRVGYVPQADGRVFPFTVREFVLMGRYPHLSPFSSLRQEDQDAVDDALARTGTGEFADRRLDTLSGGERQKVYIAAALAQQSSILLLDEPTTFLDYRHQTEIGRVLADVHAGGATIVLVTHDVNRAALESNRVLALREGRVAFDGPPRELMVPEVLERIYGTSFQLVDHPTAALPLIVPHDGREARS